MPRMSITALAYLCAVISASTVAAAAPTPCPKCPHVEAPAFPFVHHGGAPTAFQQQVMQGFFAAVAATPGSLPPTPAYAEFAALYKLAAGAVASWPAQALATFNAAAISMTEAGEYCHRVANSSGPAMVKEYLNPATPPATKAALLTALKSDLTELSVNLNSTYGTSTAAWKNILSWARLELFPAAQSAAGVQADCGAVHLAIEQLNSTLAYVHWQDKANLGRCTTSACTATWTAKVRATTAKIVAQKAFGAVCSGPQGALMLAVGNTARNAVSVVNQFADFLEFQSAFVRDARGDVVQALGAIQAGTVTVFTEANLLAAAADCSDFMASSYSSALGTCPGLCPSA